MSDTGRKLAEYTKPVIPPHLRFEASLFIFDTAFALLRATAAGLPGDTVYTGSAS